MKHFITVTATSLMVIVAMSPGHVMAQQEKFTLTVTVKNWASCSLLKAPCPFGPAMTVFVHSPFSGVSAPFDAGSCPAFGIHPCVGPTKTFEIIAGSTVTIAARALPFPDTVGFWKPETPHFTGDLDRCSNLFSDTCRFDMPASPVHIDVNFHYEFVPIVVGDEGDNSGDTP